VVAYVQEEEELPEDLKRKIKERYADECNSIRPFTDKSEECKRAYINSVLLPCVAQVNNDGGYTGDNRLDVDMEFQLFTNGLNCSGRADYVVSKGSRKMIVVEAKDANIRNGIYQTKAIMEAARILNKQVNRDWSTVKAICTDIQN